MYSYFVIVSVIYLVLFFHVMQTANMDKRIADINRFDIWAFILCVSMLIHSVFVGKF